jgi:hypothetical protein
MTPLTAFILLNVVPASLLLLLGWGAVILNNRSVDAELKRSAAAGRSAKTADGEPGTKA